MGTGCAQSEANRVPKPRMRRQNWPGRRDPRGDALKAILVKKSMDVYEGHDNPTLSVLEARMGPHALCLAREKATHTHIHTRSSPQHLERQLAESKARPAMRKAQHLAESIDHAHAEMQVRGCCSTQSSWGRGNVG
eukprot:363504-Chlamydomonas_euryale.AAC.3